MGDWENGGEFQTKGTKLRKIDPEWEEDSRIYRAKLFSEEWLPLLGIHFYVYILMHDINEIIRMDHGKSPEYKSKSV